MSYNPLCIRGRILKVWQEIEDASSIILAKNNRKFCAGKHIDYGKVIGTQLNNTGVSYTLFPWLPLLLCSVKCEQEEHQQTKELCREHNICCLNSVVLGRYDCFGCVSIMYLQQITVKLG